MKMFESYLGSGGYETWIDAQYDYSRYFLKFKTKGGNDSAVSKSTPHNQKCI